MSRRKRNNTVSLLATALVAIMLLLPVVAQNQEGSDPSQPVKNVQFQSADIRSVLTFLADYGKVNVVVSPDVEGTVTIKLSDVQWRTAMDIIGRTYGLAVVDDKGGYIRVLPADVYRKEMSERSKHAAQQQAMVPLVTKIVQIDNGVAEDMVETIEGLLTERGTVQPDARSNSIILQEVPGNMNVVIQYIKDLDKPARQIKISTKLLEIASNGLEELGIRWTAGAVTASSGGRTVAAQTGSVLADRVDDPAGLYTLGLSGGDWTLDALVEAVVSSGKGKIVAHPEITTVENMEARIQMGQKIPVKQFDASGNVVIKFEEVGTILVVTAHISGQGEILMHLKPERSTYEFDPNGVIINTSNAETNVIVKNGQTAVIGGLTTQDELETEIGVPILKDIPLIGRLFKYTQKRTESRDLIIFVTPTLVENGLAAVTNP